MTVNNMLTAEPMLRTTLPYLLHLGLAEIRYLASGDSNPAQIAALADVLEFLPRYLEPDCRPLEDSVVREQFEHYLRDFPESICAARYLAILDNPETPANY